VAPTMRVTTPLRLLVLDVAGPAEETVQQVLKRIPESLLIFRWAGHAERTT
jgi:hypothetical protein